MKTPFCYALYVIYKVSSPLPEETYLRGVVFNVKSVLRVAERSLSVQRYRYRSEPDVKVYEQSITYSKVA